MYKVNCQGLSQAQLGALPDVPLTVSRSSTIS